MRYYAIPTRATNRVDALKESTERPGTDGVLSGDYKSVFNAVRYNFSRNADPDTIYRISTHNSNGVWRFVLVYKLGD